MRIAQGFIPCAIALTYKRSLTKLFYSIICDITTIILKAKQNIITCKVVL